MSFHAATSAAQPNSSRNALRVLILSCEVRNGGCSKPSSNGAVAVRIDAAFWANSACRDAKGDLGISGSLPFRIPSSTRDHASGPIRRPAARRRSALATPPFQGLGSSQNKFENGSGRTLLKLLPGPAKKALLGTWEPGPLARFARCDPSRIREIQRNGDHHHVLKQSHPHRIHRR